MLARSMAAFDFRTAIHDACQALESQDLVAVASGNVSVRLMDGEPGRIAITPSQVPYAELTPDQIVVVTLDGAVAEGGETPSSEMPTHLAVYAARPDVGAVVHTHSVFATALAVAGRELPVILDEQVVVLGGPVRVAEFASGSTRELADNAVAALGDRQAVFLSNHGAVAVGKDLGEAVAVAVFLERVAKIYAGASAVGTPRALPDQVVQEQIAAFRKRRV